MTIARPNNHATSFAPIYRSAALRQVESAAQSQQPRPSLMERAGMAAAGLAQSLLDERGRRVLVVAGPGNNGGDAFEAATHLKNAFLRVTLVFAGDLARLPADAAAANRKWTACGGITLKEIPPDQTWDLVIDGLFGIGLSRALDGQMAEIVSHINDVRTATGCPVLALDVPSGLDSDTGVVRGAAVHATHTLTFIALKPGLLTLDGPDHCGHLQCADLGLDPAALHSPEGELLDHAVRRALPDRPKNFHKGHAGNVIVIGGSAGMVGAVLISGRAALQSGAGKVFVGALATDAPTFDPMQPELMFRSARNALKEDGVLLVGPGLGKDRAAATLLRDVIASSRTLVLDADALNLVSEHPATRASVHRREAPTLMTPHPAEAARLLRTTTAAVQQDRVAATLALADRYNSFVVLKGNGSVLAQPVGVGQESGRRWWINPTGNPGMASAGMGDALGGLLASFLAQGMPPMQALKLAVWVHGAAADRLCETDSSGTGPLGITASDVIAQSRRLLNQLRG